MKNQETLEEADETISDFIKRESKSANESVGIVKGAKWYQKRSYSEEDLKQFAFQCVANFLSNNDNKVEIELVEIIMDRNNKKFEQFKKK